jgi:hypothetical protein
VGFGLAHSSSTIIFSITYEDALLDFSPYLTRFQSPTKNSRVAINVLDFSVKL